jgi:hypothetical protein
MKSACICMPRGVALLADLGRDADHPLDPVDALLLRLAGEVKFRHLMRARIDPIERVLKRCAVAA